MASKIEKTNHEDWLQQRRNGIGGSDAAKVLGVSRWGGPLSVYLDKVDGVSPEVNADAVYFGTQLEDFVAREFAQREGVKIRRCNKINVDSEYPFLLANVDRVINGTNQGLECKTTSAFKADEWKGDNLPDEYYCQTQHYCRVMGWEGCWIACLVGGQKFIYKYVPRNEDFIDELVTAEVDFWKDHVLPKVPPTPNFYDKDTLQNISQFDAEMLDATEADLEAARKLLDLRNARDKLDTEITELENIIKGRIGEHEGIGGIATWRTAKSSSVTDWKAIAKELEPSQELIDKYTSEKAGSRRFLFKFKVA